ncbi:hypothetical protein BVX98_04710 [bacterium F11]|nr:hypothetical protein BVX98_04710 [bacterium F11]
MEIKNQYLKIWGAFSSHHRLRIIRLLLRGELCVRDFKKIFGWPQSTTSRHLLYLEKNRIIQSRQDGLWRYYSLRPAEFPLLELLLVATERGLSGVAVFGEDRKKLKDLKDHLGKISHKKYSKRISR